jgi:DNA-binding FadR family transcriptional regulator
MVQATSQPRDRQQSRCRHRAVLEAIRAGDPDAAEKAMQEHIECTMQHLEAIHRQQQRNPA